MEIRDLTVDDLEQALDVRNRSFGPMPSSFNERWHNIQRRSLADHRSLAIEDGGRIVAMARINHFRQWWNGRAVPMAGIGGVVVLPEVRGRGVGKALMTAILERSLELGFSLSALYPATVPVYRAVGYELAGVQRTVTVPAAALRTLAGRGPYVDIRRTEPGDETTITSLISGLHEKHRDAGPIEYRPVEWLEDLRDDEYFAYLADDGFVGYGFDEGNKTLRVSHLVAGSEATLRTLWSLVGSGSSIATTVRLPISPEDPLHWLMPDLGITADHDSWWMLRLLDAEPALVGRGYPPHAEVDLALRLHDPQVAANDGTWRLSIAVGAATLAPADAVGVDALELGPQGLAALYAGWPMQALRRGGLARAGRPEDDVALNEAFAARPYMLDYF